MRKTAFLLLAACGLCLDGGAVPAVFVGAYESLDGRRAFVLANATAQKQNVRCAWPKEPEMSFRLAPRELRLVTAAQAVEVRQVFREERFTRGNVNLRPLQAADAADWIWIADGGPAKDEMDAVRFACDFACGGRG
ncbi:MAG: hypothetical protein IJJ84_14335, partial [Kiritimatiellae bacterium]|nr:hypothetical protein [Kiritimatiellia bacterium]